METLSAFSLPPGFGFHPTDVELISHYLKRKISGLKIDLEVIPEVDIYKHEPWDLPAKCSIPTRDSKWHFFTCRDRKYPNGSRSNRATEAGYWKSTGKDRNIKFQNHVIGTKKTLVFHKGRPPCGKRTDWIMHEYYINENKCKASPNMKDIYVLCRVTKRNGLASEDEKMCATQVEDIDNCTKQPKEVTKLEAKEESSPSENIDDYEAWFTELYDPDFCAIPTISELKGEAKISQADLISLPLKQEPVDSSFLSNVSEGLNVLLSDEDDIHGILQSDFNDINFDALGEFDIKALDSAAMDDLLPHVFPFGGYAQKDMETMYSTVSVNSHDNNKSSLVQGNDDKTIYSTFSSDNVETGIQIRERRGRSSEVANHRFRLQIHKMESRNGGSLNQTLNFVSKDRLLDLNHVLNEESTPYSCSAQSELSIVSNASDPTVTNVEEKHTTEPKESPVASKTRQILVSETSSLRKRRSAEPVDSERSSYTLPNGNNCIKGVLRGLSSFLRPCPSAGLNCFFLVTCMIGTAALVLYFLLGDARRFLSSSSTFGI